MIVTLLVLAGVLAGFCIGYYFRSKKLNATISVLESTTHALKVANEQLVLLKKPG